MRFARFHFGYAVLVLLLAQNAAANPIRTTAPKLTLSKWLNGTEKDFRTSKKYRVYLFWAPWSDPKGTQLKLISDWLVPLRSQVNLISIVTWDGDAGTKTLATIQRTEAFLKQFPSLKLGFIGIDSQAQTTGNTWMGVAKSSELPYLFLCDDADTIYWVGNYDDGAKLALDSILSGSFDIGREEKNFEAKQRANQLYRSGRKLLESSRLDEGLSKLDDAIRAFPEFEEVVFPTKFSTLIREKRRQGLDYGADAYSRGQITRPSILSNTAFAMMTFSMYPKDLEIALAMAKDAVQRTKSKDPLLIDVLGQVHHRRKEFAEAIACAEKAILIASSEKFFPEPVLKEMKKRLELYQTDKARAGVTE